MSEQVIGNFVVFTTLGGLLLVAGGLVFYAFIKGFSSMLK